MERRYTTIAWALTLVLVIWALVASNVDSIPTWTIAIPGVITGFWWAFGRSALGDGDATVEQASAPRDAR
ncbi:hypothetical protein BCF74_10895 [Knoellia remsis]|uniref:Uncharacterized protein n=1 Tax=Knoellia remsis TaxID=407159 RepID=A0A2T0UQE4_9MICO|nr:hypothetical protein [Knoellia remsis]PRY60149.1 hypothetical protein BCF74_10895 [Knoellia remsis]